MKPLLIFAATVMAIALIGLSFQPQESATTLASCPGCKVIPKPSTPDHSLLLLALALAVSLMGAHSLHHYSGHKNTRVLLTILLATSFIALTAIFGLRLVSPSSAATVIAQQGTSVLAALGILALFHLAAFELGKFYEPQKQYRETDAEDEWEQWQQNEKAH